MIRTAIAAGACALALLIAPAPISSALASGYRHHYRYTQHVRHFARYHHNVSWRHARAHVARGSRPSCFYVAASMGGPCGCWAAANILGVVDHVWRGVNLWLADDWMKFPHVSPAEANAAVWPGRHVAPIVPGTYDGRSIVVADSWATHRVRTAGLVFVRAPAKAAKRHTELVRYAAAPL